MHGIINATSWEQKFDIKGIQFLMIQVTFDTNVSDLIQ